jgi:hypothetical protein
VRITVVETPSAASPAQALTEKQRDILAVIDHYVALTGEACPGSILARRFDRNHSTIDKHLATLHRKGWLLTSHAPATPCREYVDLLSRSFNRTVLVDLDVHLTPGQLRFVHEYRNADGYICVALTIDRAPVDVAVAMAHDAFDRAKLSWTSKRYRDNQVVAGTKRGSQESSEAATRRGEIRKAAQAYRAKKKYHRSRANTEMLVKYLCTELPHAEPTIRRHLKALRIR